MTHDELLAKIDAFTCCSGAHELALLAVLKLHKPYKTLENIELCSLCLSYPNESYPCETIQAIRKALA